MKEKRLSLYEPKLEDLWFRKLMLEDELTMSFNHAYGGTISFLEEKWERWFDIWIKENEGKRYYRYLVNEENKYVGEIAYHYDEENKRYMANIIIYSKYRHQGYGTLGLELLCLEAKNNGIKDLYDDIAFDNNGISIFYKLGFEKISSNKEIILLKKHL